MVYLLTEAMNGSRWASSHSPALQWAAVFVPSFPFSVNCYFFHFELPIPSESAVHCLTLNLLCRDGSRLVSFSSVSVEQRTRFYPVFFHHITFLICCLVRSWIISYKSFILSAFSSSVSSSTIYSTPLVTTPANSQRR